jgi:hypothetical integral membrane protein (TIGR02206 family)
MRFPPEFRTFELFGPDHLTAMAVVILVALAVGLAGRLPVLRNRGVALARLLTVLLILNEGIGMVLMARAGVLTLEQALPLHLCDVSLIAVCVGLLFRSFPAFEFAYFFGLGGTALAMLTPDIAHGFPDPLFIKFFIGHGGIVVGTVFLMSVFAMRPAPGAVRRMIVIGNAYILIMGTANWMLGTNYAYLAHKPLGKTPIDYFGPWPWYILVLEAIGILLLVVLNAPHALARRTKSAA